MKADVVSCSKCEDQTHLLALESGACFPPVAPTLAKYWMTFLVFSVFPAPDSPLGIRMFFIGY